ncbi:hypothetical protein HanRHA438_Chr12g0570271 [Helianthus annuus]|nr:hypothetical protein HanRHA438_Chr12g0570271 [Helianthus annuus]
MMNATMMTKQKTINHYIEEYAELKKELETEKIENERIRRLLPSYSSSAYLIDILYPTIAGFEFFKIRRRKRRTLVRNKVSVITSVRLRYGNVILPENQMRNNSKRQSISS